MNEKRIDEVSRYYESAARMGFAISGLFWLTVLISLFVPISQKWEPSFSGSLQVAFILFVLLHWVTSQINRFYLIPKAEKKRRQQLLSNAFRVPLSHDKTSKYYNNDFPPGPERLGAITMENSLFSKSVAEKMLVPKRYITSGYMAIWVLIFALRQPDLDKLIWITQFVFSSTIIVDWINLEWLRSKYEKTYCQLHSHFLQNIGGNTPTAIASILDVFADYESAKSSAGYLLSSRVFRKLNPQLSKKWDQIRQELNMDTEQGVSLENDFVDNINTPDT